MNNQRMIPWDLIIEILNKYQSYNPGYLSQHANKFVNDEIYEWYYEQDPYQESLKERVHHNQSRQTFEKELLTRWYQTDAPKFSINEVNGEYEDELVQMAWTGYYLAWNKWSGK